MRRALDPATRELFSNLVRREIRGRYKGSLLGIVWTLVTPLIMMLAYTLVFSVLFRFNDGRIPYYALYVLVGLAIWLFFSGSLVASTSSLIGSANLIKKVQFPRAIMPIATVISHGVTLVAMLVVLIPIGLWLSPGEPWVMLLLPVALIPIIMMVVGCALAVSVLNVYFRDIEHILAALVLPWFFLTPVLFSFDTFPLATEHTWLVDVLTLGNFVTPFVLLFQNVVYWGVVPNWGIWLYTCTVGPAILAGGYLIFNRLQRNLAVEL
ncbi:MAG: ABC transporter permease [Miltoncostaeaceae bacterium]